MEPTTENQLPKTEIPKMAPSMEEFTAMIEENFDSRVPLEGTVVKGKVLDIKNRQAIIDIGFKTEGRVDLKEFTSLGHAAEVPNVQIGDEVDVFLDRIENSRGEAVLSREKANREVAWDNLELATQNNTPVEGVIAGRVKGGFSVDLDGAMAFLPGSQVDVRPLGDVTPLFDQPQQFQIVKMDRRRGNVVVSRRAVLEKATSAERARVIEHIKRDDIVEGPVKNIVDFGAFVDLGGIDGLLHVTDMSWRRILHPSEMVTVGDVVRVKVVRVNREGQRISLGMKQLEPDPWEGIEAKYPVGMKITGRVANITEFGAFVELEAGVEGLIHVSEMSWTKKSIHPGKIISTSQEVEVMVLNTDPTKRRISLGLKQCEANPWEAFEAAHPVGTQMEGVISTITEYGIFVSLDEGLDGMVHLSDLSWEKPGEEAIKAYNKGDTVKLVFLSCDVEKERVALGIKQLTGDPFVLATTNLAKGSVVSAVVSRVDTGGIEVDVDGLRVFIRRQDLAVDQGEQRPTRFAEGDRLEAQVTTLNRKSNIVGLSIKALESAREKEAIRQYGSTSSGAMLGEILGPALHQSEESSAETEEDAKDKAVEADAAKASEQTSDSADQAESVADADTASEPGAVADEASQEVVAVEEPAAEEAAAEELAEAADDAAEDKG